MGEDEAKEGRPRAILDKNHYYKAFKLEANEIPFLEARDSNSLPFNW